MNAVSFALRPLLELVTNAELLICHHKFSIFTSSHSNGEESRGGWGGGFMLVDKKRGQRYKYNSNYSNNNITTLLRY